MGYPAVLPISGPNPPRSARYTYSATVPAWLYILCIYSGAPAGFEGLLARGAWSKEDGGRRVAVGGADRTVTIWEIESGRVLYKVHGSRSRYPLSTNGFMMILVARS